MKKAKSILVILVILALAVFTLTACGKDEGNGGDVAGEPDKNGQFKVLSTMKKLGPREVCTFSYFIIGNFDDEAKAENLMSYLKTKFCRFLLLQAVSSINLSKDKFIFVPLQDFSKPWTDEELYQKYNLEKDEIDFINSMIRPME